MTGLSELAGAMQGGVLPLTADMMPIRPFSFPGNTAVGLDFTFAGGSESAEHQGYIWAAQPARKSPQGEGVYSEALAYTHALWQDSRKKLMDELEALKTSYAFRNERAIVRFCSTHRGTIGILANAVSELRHSFSQDALLNLEALIEEDESISLYAIVVWRGSVEGAEVALEDFDERWWLNQVPQPGLTFTYELA